jgi:hypothetical protein
MRWRVLWWKKGWIVDIEREFSELGEIGYCPIVAIWMRLKKAFKTF